MRCRFRGGAPNLGHKLFMSDGSPEKGKNFVASVGVPCRKRDAAICHTRRMRDIKLLFGGKIMFALPAHTMQQSQSPVASAARFLGLTYNAFKSVICLYSVADYKSRSALNASRERCLRHGLSSSQSPRSIHGFMGKLFSGEMQSASVKTWVN